MSEYKLSIIIPVFGVEKYIMNCAKSIFEQTYSNCEYIFVNDYTQDNSIEMLKELIEQYGNLKSKIKIINNRYNQGLAQSRNIGVKFSSGDYVMHVDSDDELAPGAVQICMNALNKNFADVLVFGFKHMLNYGERVEHIIIPDNRIQYINQIIARDNNVCICGGIYKRTLYTDNNVWAIPGVNMGEDFSTKPRLLYYADKIISIDKPFYFYNHLNENSYTRSFNIKNVQDIEKAIIVLRSFFNDQPDGYLFQNSINVGAIKSKVILIKNWGLSVSGGPEFLAIKNLFRDVNPNNVPFVDKVLLFLCDNQMRFLTKVFVKSGIIVKRLCKSLS